MSRFVYADNAATTAVSDTCFNAMTPFLREQYGNPSSIYRFGGAAKKALTEAREKVAKALGAESSEIF
ncbi:MAG: aminotransferase class V-fold PLP-dependent enzyme, partial [Oscillospiraceae bacterium]|nr:aminotransferase class V-fold PLP-dependent enzyme [Oscillospiraceae bacterium]